MKFTIQSTAIEGAAILLSKVINAKNSLPILGDILCEVADNQLTMTGSDGECSIGTTLDLDTMEGEGRFCLDAGRLLTAARQLGNRPLTITCCTESDYMFTIEHQDGQIHFLAESADEYPVIEQPTWESNFHNLQSNRIGEAIKRCLWSVCTDELRPVMCGVHICTVQKYDALDIVASDGHALVRTRMLNEDIEPGQKIDATLPTKAAKVLADTLTDVEPISLRFAEGKCQVETTRYCMTFRLIDQPYPKYNSIIPTDNNIEACVGNRELARSIKRVLPFAPDKSQMLSLHFEADIDVVGVGIGRSVFPMLQVIVSWNNATTYLFKSFVFRKLPLITKKIMPKRNIVQIQLPPEQPDCCAECPLLGLVPKYVSRPKNSKETLVCCGTMEAITQRGSKVRASKRDTNHPLKRPCDNRWHSWMQLAGRKLGISTQTYNDCRIPYECTLQLQIKFHK